MSRGSIVSEFFFYGFRSSFNLTLIYTGILPGMETKTDKFCLQNCQSQKIITSVFSVKLVDSSANSSSEWSFLGTTIAGRIRSLYKITKIYDIHITYWMWFFADPPDSSNEQRRPSATATSFFLNLPNFSFQSKIDTLTANLFWLGGKRVSRAFSVCNFYTVIDTSPTTASRDVTRAATRLHSAEFYDFWLKHRLKT